MPHDSSIPTTLPRDEARSRTGKRLIAAAVLIGLAIGGLALVDRYRERPAGLTPPHEPSQTLITPPAPETNVSVSNPELPASPPPPPRVVNNETLAPLPAATDDTPSRPAKEPAPADKTAAIPGKAYMIQIGVFTSAANAQALQKQLQRAGIKSHLETRVQIGPFKDRRDADKALARARKLGINAVMVSSR